MSEIREFNCFNHIKIKNMKKYLDSPRNNYLMNVLSNSLFKFIHNILPLKYKFLDESYFIKEEKESGFITISPVNGNSEKLIISQLYLSKNGLYLTEELVNYIVQKYGKSGTSVFYTLMDSSYPDLIQILLKKCAFRQCSTQDIWKVSKKKFKKSKTFKYRRFKDSDLQEITDIYNDSLITYFKPTLERPAKEFSENMYNGLTYSSKYRFVIEDNTSDKIIGYFSISTDDNENYIADFNFSDGYEIDIDGIMYFVTREILKRQRRFKLYIKIKNYLTTAKIQEQYVQEKNFKHKATKIVLIKDFYKYVKQPEQAGILAETSRV